MRNRTKRIVISTLIVFISGITIAQSSSPSTLDVANWNILWFGSSSNGPSDLNLQETNVKKYFAC